MRRRSRRARMKRRLLISGIVLVSVIVVFLAVFLWFQGAVNRVPKDRIAKNIYIGNANISVDVSGMTQAQAKKALDEQIETCAKETVFLLANGKEIEVSLGDLGLQIKAPDSLAKKALAYGKKGSLFKRYNQLQGLKKEKHLLEAEYIVDKKTMTKFFAEGMEGLEDAAQNATIKRENGTFVFTEGKVGKKIDVDKSFKSIQEYIKYDWKTTTNNKVELTTILSEPDIKAEQLKVIKDPIGTFHTSYSGGGNRDKNILVATSKINGALLMPGDEYSASEGMGPTDAEHGYYPGASYENGKVVQTYGGGVCQVSTTLYNAVLMAELEITERWAHSMLVGYVKPSMDAAIAEGYKDFKFKNNKDYPVYVEGVAKGGVLTFTIYGVETRAEDREVIYESEVISEKPMNKKFVTSNAALGQKSIVESGHKEMKAKLWKIVKEKGVEVSRTNMNNSSYQGSTEKVSIGIATDNAAAKKLVTDAVATQNEAKINAAIAEAKKLIAESQKPQTPSTPTATTPTPGTE